MLKKFLNSFLCIMVLFYSLGVFASCLKEGDKVIFNGYVSEELYYGPPGWGEDKEHDEKLHEWVLHLDKPLACVEDADTDNKDWNQNVQLIMRDGNDYKTKRNFLGKNINIAGVVFLAESGYHMTSILLDDARFVITDK